MKTIIKTHILCLNCLEESVQQYSQGYFTVLTSSKQIEDSPPSMYVFVVKMASLKLQKEKEARNNAKFRQANTEYKLE